MSNEEKVLKLLSLSARLNRLVRLENEYLEGDGPPKGLKDMLGEKQALGNAYESQVEALREEGAMEGVDPGLRRKLREAMETFSVLLEKNRARLTAKLETGKHLFDLIIASAREQRVAQGGYDQSGTLDGADRQAYRPGVTMGVSQEI